MREAGSNGGPVSWAGDDLQVCPHQLGPLLHPQYSEAPPLQGVCLGRSHLEPHAIILDAQR